MKKSDVIKQIHRINHAPISTVSLANHEVMRALLLTSFDGACSYHQQR